MPEASAVSDVRPPPRSTPKILVLDDEAMIRGLLKLHLGNAGYDILEAEDAIVGGHLVIACAPDLIICDVDMPYMDGYQFVSALKSDPTTSEIPVVFLTTDGNVADHAKRLGAAAYLNKPVMADRLVRVVGHVLKEAQATLRPLGRSRPA